MPGRGDRLPAARAIAACVAVVALLATGCDSHSKPQAVEDDPTSSAPLVTPGAPSTLVAQSAAAETTVSSPSSAIKGESALASAYPIAAAAEPRAVKVVREFFDAMNHETDTGDEQPISKLIQPTCTRCISGVVGIKNLLDGGHTIRGGHVHLLSVDRVYPSYDNIVTVVVTNAEDAGAQVDSKGNVVRSFTAVPPKQLIFDVLIDHSPPVIANLSLTSS
jgi:hypothetical protein